MCGLNLVIYSGKGAVVVCAVVCCGHYGDGMCSTSANSRVMCCPAQGHPLEHQTQGRDTIMYQDDLSLGLTKEHFLAAKADPISRNVR